MTDFVELCPVSELPPGERRYFDFEEESIIVFNVDGVFYAVADLCTHDDGPLEDAERDGFAIECPRHGAQFDIRTGAVLCFPAVVPIPTYETKVEGDILYVEDPDAW